MSIRRRRPLRPRLAHWAVFWLSTLIIVCAESLLWGRAGQQVTAQPSTPGRQIVVLLDTNPHQNKVLTVELALAEEIIQKLNQPGNAFSVITFGSQPPVLVKSRVHAAAAIAALQNVTVEQTKEKYFSVHLYDAVKLAFGQFTGDADPKSLLVISEGNDYFPGKTFKQTVSRARQLHIAFDIAMIADHTLYGTKGIQRYGFDLRRLAGKTHGRYVEARGGPKKISGSLDRLSARILGLDRGQ